MSEIPNPTIREIVIAAFERINELCLDQEWGSSRRKVLELSHAMVQELSENQGVSIEFSDIEIANLQTAIQYTRFSAPFLTAERLEAFKILGTKLDEIADFRRDNS